MGFAAWVLVLGAPASCTLSFDVGSDGAPPARDARREGAVPPPARDGDPGDDAAGAPDGGSLPLDAQPLDTGAAEGGAPELGPPDLGSPEPPDLGSPEPPDLGPPEPPDLGPPDAGPRCAGTCLDVVLLMDVSGSHWTMLGGRERPLLGPRVAAPLLAMAGTRVGVATFSDYPTDPYGGPGDRPFDGLLPPAAELSPVAAALDGLSMGEGGDRGEALIEALRALTSPPPHPTAHPFTCSAASEVPGGCWRPEARRAIVVLTEEAHHGLPQAGGALFSPYGSALSPPPPIWPDVRDAVSSSGAALFGVVPTGSTAEAQLTRMLEELGQPTDGRLALIVGNDPAPPFDALVSLLASYAASAP